MVELYEKLKQKIMSTYPEREKSDASRNLEPVETYIPDEILRPQTETSGRVGEVVWPQDRAGEIVHLSDQLSKLRQNQLVALESFDSGKIPTNLPMHKEVSERYNKLQIDQLNAMQKIIEAQKKAKLNEIKAGNLDAEREVSEFNRNRILEYSKTGAKAVGFTAKYLAKGTLEVGKLGLLLTKETFKAAADIWYSLWGAHRDYRSKYPNQNDI